MQRSIKSVLIAMSLLLHLTVGATDYAMLESLAKKGILTQAEISEITKESVRVDCKPLNETRQISFSGRIQVLYSMVSADDGVASDTVDGISLRRVYFGTHAKLSDDWRVSITSDLLNHTHSTHKMVSAYIEKKYDLDFLYGWIKAGFYADNFAYESMTSSKNLLTTERSLASRYFAGSLNEKGKYAYSGYGAINFAGESMGLFFKGKFRNNEKIEYGCAITSPETYTIRPPKDGRNIPAFWFNVNYKDNINLSDEEFKLHTGIYTGVSPQGHLEMSHLDKTSRIYGVNPFFDLSNDRITTWGDILFANVQNGKANMQDANLFGANLVAEYKFDTGDIGKIAPVMRLSYVNSDGRGVRISDSTRRGPNLYNDFRKYYNEGAGIYLGINWYFPSEPVKLMFGYERARFWGEVNNNDARSANVDVFRTQLQIEF